MLTKKLCYVKHACGSNISLYKKTLAVHQHKIQNVFALVSCQWPSIHE
jgi:hypothetical protein